MGLVTGKNSRRDVYAIRAKGTKLADEVRLPAFSLKVVTSALPKTQGLDIRGRVSVSTKMCCNRTVDAMVCNVSQMFSKACLKCAVRLANVEHGTSPTPQCIDHVGVLTGKGPAHCEGSFRTLHVGISTEEGACLAIGFGT
jgi:hypothetical protein